VEMNYEKNDTVLYLDTNMDAGHGGASGRFEAQIGKRIYFFIGFRIDYKIVVVY
jgi:protease II